VPTMADLAGTNFGISEPSSISYVIPRLMAEEAGVDFDTVTPVPVGGTSARAQALVNRRRSRIQRCGIPA
jgi:ABC-type nitrate/sulfonate/bicarbonate transport system substrate-binding protein